MTYEIISSADSAKLEEMARFIRSHPKGHFLQTPQWREVKTFWNWRGVLAYDSSGRLQGALSLLIRPLPLGMSMLYAPRGPVCDRSDPNVLRVLWAGAREVGRRHHALLLQTDPDELSENRNFRAMMADFGFRERRDEGFGNIQPQFVFRMDMRDKSEDALLAGFSQKTRYNIRLARRRGVTVEQYRGDRPVPDAVMDSFAALMEITGQRDHFTVRGADYFRGLLAAFGHDACLFMARYEGQPIAGTLEVFCGEKAWYLYGASGNAHRNVMPNYLLQWEMIRWAVENKCRIYDFRGVSGDLDENNPLYGLYKFKKGFNSELVEFIGEYDLVISRFWYDFLKLATKGYQGLNKVRYMLKNKKD